jgi:hypothetical protein
MIQHNACLPEDSWFPPAMRIVTGWFSILHVGIFSSGLFDGVFDQVVDSLGRRALHAGRRRPGLHSDRARSD